MQIDKYNFEEWNDDASLHKNESVIFEFLKGEIDRGNLANIRTAMEKSNARIVNARNLLTGENIYMYAIRCGCNPAFIHQLMGLNVDMMTCNYQSQTILHVAVAEVCPPAVLFRILEKLRITVHPVKLRKFLDRKDNGGLSALHMSVTKLHDRCLSATLVQQGANTEIRNSRGMTPFMVAVLHDNEEQVLMLHGLYCNINAVDDHGQTSLFHVGSKAMLNLLLRIGIDQGIRDFRGNTFIEDTLLKSSNRYMSWEIIPTLDTSTALNLSTIFQNNLTVQVKAKLLWMRLRRIVKGMYFSCLKSTSKADLIESTRTCFSFLAGNKSDPSARDLRMKIRRYIFCEFSHLEDTVNPTTLSLQPISSLEWEFVYIFQDTRGPSINRYAFDIRELVKLRANPYTQTCFTAFEIATFRERHRVLSYLRETMAVGNFHEIKDLPLEDEEVKRLKVMIERIEEQLPYVPCNFFSQDMSEFRRRALVALVQVWSPTIFDDATTDLQSTQDIVEKVYHTLRSNDAVVVAVGVAIDLIFQAEQKAHWIAKECAVATDTMLAIPTELEKRLLIQAESLFIPAKYPELFDTNTVLHTFFADMKPSENEHPHQIYSSIENPIIRKMYAVFWIERVFSIGEVDIQTYLRAMVNETTIA
jgi:ankyrin repeat protein